MKTIESDYLVIGSGLAGLMVAWKLRSHGRVTVASKQSLGESNSDRAQAGIACAVDPGDSVERHVQDTSNTGCGLSEPSVAYDILSQGGEGVRELESIGIEFARRSGKDDEYDLGREGGHSRRRVLHAGDVTGHEIITVLVDRVLSAKDMSLLPNLMAIDLVPSAWLGIGGPNKCLGAYFLDRMTGEILAVRARHTILATGGAGKVYLYTSNPDTATGDGMAMAWRAGLPMQNMEFVQFHPTCLYHPEAKSFLISEAVRGEGGVLINGDGEEFVSMHDRRGSLAPRDIVARAIDHEMKTRGEVCVYLDITSCSRDFLQRRFPNIYAECLRFGIDMSEDPIPVVPAAHYFCGGVRAGTDGATDIAGLHAVGEVACTGLHGANRLASNSLLEALVCSRKLADKLISGEDRGAEDSSMSIPDWEPGRAVPSDEAVVVEHNWNEVRTCMWDYVGIVRTNRRLERARRRIHNLRSEIREYYRDYEVTRDILELRNIADVGELVIRSAACRRESRGLHYTLDYPQSAARAETTMICDPPGVRA